MHKAKLEMKDLVKKRQFVSLLLGILAITLLDEVVLSRFFDLDEFDGGGLVFKAFSQYLLPAFSGFVRPFIYRLQGAEKAG